MVRHRRKGPPRAWLAVVTAATLAGPVLLLASPPAANADTSGGPVFATWQPGTSLPTSVALDPANPTTTTQTINSVTDAAGNPTPIRCAANCYTWMALPSAATEANLQPGDAVPLTTPDEATPDDQGNVNLVAIPNAGGAYCVPSFYAHLGKHQVNIGQGYTTVNGINEDFDYSNYETSTLGAGVSGSPKSGFSGHGSVSISNGSGGGETYPTATSKAFRIYQTTFLVDEYEWYTNVGHNPCNEYTVHPVQWVTGSAIVNSSGAPGATYCGGRQSKGAKLTISTSRATTFSAGWTVYGVGFSADTGYNTSASASWKWVSAGNGVLCGTTGYPPSPGVGVAHY